MFFVVIMAFALVLSDTLPPERCMLLAGPSLTRGTPLIGTLTVVAAQLLLVAVAAFAASRLTIARLDGTAEGHDRATSAFSRCQHILLGIIATTLVGTMVFTPWAPLVREGWHLGRVPLLGDLLILAPFFISLTIIWSVFYPIDLRIRKAAMALAGHEVPPPPAQQQGNEHDAARENPASAPGRASVDGLDSLQTYLLDRFRHHVLIIAVPMSMIVVAKYFTDSLKSDPNQHKEALLPIFDKLPLADAILGLASVAILASAPLMLRYIWATEPLPAGPLRDRFIRTCQRIGLRYREILLWRTHGMAINAAVMGFIAPMRYILVSDALLNTMDEDEIEAVFGHEAGHVRHWHLQFFILFALVSMYVSGGVFLLLMHTGFVTQIDVLQLVALAVLLAAWLFGFGWLSRRFERQADLYGVRCVTPDVRSCTRSCPVHGTLKRQDAETPKRQKTLLSRVLQSAIHNPQSEIRNSPSLCTSAASLFGRTLVRIADLNGIPKDAPSWRHGSIEDRCRLIERFAADAAAMKRFDRNILLIKAGLIGASIVGTVIAAAVYYRPIVDALR